MKNTTTHCCWAKFCTSYSLDIKITAIVGAANNQKIIEMGQQPNSELSINELPTTN